MRVCVATIVHHPEDARIMHRQIRALLDAGHEVTYVAPFTHCNVTPDPAVTAIDVPRAVGPRRARAIRAARGALRRGVRNADLLIVHDLDLLLALPPLRRPPTVWDARRETDTVIHRFLSTRAERHLHVIRPTMTLPAALGQGPADGDISDLPPGFAPRLGQESGSATIVGSGAESGSPTRRGAGTDATTGPGPSTGTRRGPGAGATVGATVGSRSEGAGELGRGHAVVPEATQVAVAPLPPGDTRLVHIGRLTAESGVTELIELAQRLVPHGIRLDLLGEADRTIRPLLRDAQRVGLLDWFGYVPNRHALRMAEGALAGLSLGRPPATPTRILDYLGRGLPIVTTPCELVERVGCGTIVPYGDVAAAVRAVLDLKEDPARRVALGARGHAEARLHHHWPDHARAFVTRLEEWAGVTSPVSAHSLAV